jgi:hypothetical protein
VWDFFYVLRSSLELMKDKSLKSAEHHSLRLCLTMNWTERSGLVL